MNSLADKFGDKLAILGFPCNQARPTHAHARRSTREPAELTALYACSQFGHQTNEGDDEFLNTLKHVRPGGGFEPAATVDIFAKTNVREIARSRAEIARRYRSSAAPLAGERRRRGAALQVAQG